MGEIYGIVKDDKIVYVGQTIIGSNKRLKKHFNSAKNNTDSALYRAIRKYGPKKFGVIVLESCENNNLNTREMWHIKNQKTYTDGYNENTDRS
jgi:group I intron endonuclease